MNNNCRHQGVESVLNQIIDLADYARMGKQPPLAKGYRLKINNESFVIQNQEPTGREVLTLAGLLPAEKYTLRLKIPGCRPEKIKLNEKVNLRRPGLEKFKALPRDQTEG